MIREALFSILGPAVDGVHVLDLYAGTGAVALEALGRGAARATLAEISRTSLAAIRTNIDSLGVGDRTEVVAGDVRKLLSAGRFSGGGFGLVFIGPPFDKGLCLPTLERISPDLLAGGDPIVVVHGSPRETLPETAGVLELRRLKDYRDNLLHFYGLQDCLT